MSPDSPSENETRRNPRVASALLLVANVLFFWPVIFHGRVFSSHGAALSVFPWRAEAAVDDPRAALLADPASAGAPFMRKLPERIFWNRSASGGAPGAVNLVQGFLSPFAWVPALALPEAAVETGTLFLKLNAGFLFLFVFLRRRGVAENAAACGAAAWGWSGAQAAWWLWMQSSVTVAIPLLFLAIERAREDRRFTRSVVLASLAFALFFAGGYPFMVLFGAVAAVAYGAAVPSDRAENRPALGRLTLAFVLAAGLLLPAILVSARTIRATGQVAARRGLAGELKLPLRHAELFAFPLAFGDPLSGSYRPLTASRWETWIETAVGVGPAALGLALLGAANRRNRRLWTYGAALACATAALLYAPPIRDAAASLPILSAGLLERVKILAVLGIALAAVPGAEVVDRALAGGAFARASAALPFAVGVPLVLVAARLYPAVPPGDAVFTKTPGLAALARETAGPSRFLATGWTLYPDLGSAFGLEDVRGHLMFEKSWRRLLSAADPRIYGRTGTLLVSDPRTLRPDSPALDLAGVSAIAAEPGTFGGAGLPKVYEGPDLVVFRRASAFPRFFLTRRWERGGLDDVLAASRETLRRTAYVDPADAGHLPPPAPDGPEGTVRVERYASDAFRLRTDAPTAAVLVSSGKLFAPYWTARLDGRAAPPIRVDGMFFGLAVPPGAHVVEGRFRIPLSEAAISAGSALAIAALLLVGLRPERAR